MKLSWDFDTFFLSASVPLARAAVGPALALCHSTDGLLSLQASFQAATLTHIPVRAGPGFLASPGPTKQCLAAILRLQLTQRWTLKLSLTYQAAWHHTAGEVKATEPGADEAEAYSFTPVAGVSHAKLTNCNISAGQNTVWKAAPAPHY